MGVRYRCTSFFSVDGVEYLIDIHDPTYNSAIKEIELEAPFFTLTVDNDRVDNGYANIAFTKCDVFVLAEAQTEVGLRVLLTSNNDFYIRIYREGVSYWSGLLQSDQCSYENQAIPYGLKLSFTDNLKSLEVQNDITSWANIVDLFIQLMKKTSIDVVYSTSESFISTSSQFYEEDQHDLNWVNNSVKTFDALAYTRHSDPSVIIAPEPEELSEVGAVNAVPDNRTCMEILLNELKIFGLRLVMRKGVFTFFQIDQFTNENNFFNYYSKNYVVALDPANSTGIVNLNISEILSSSVSAISGGMFSFLPAVERVDMVYDSIAGLYVFSKYNYDITQLTAGSNVSQFTNVFLQLQADFTNVVSRSVISQSWNWDVEFAITIKVGINYFTNVNGTPQWTTVASVYKKTITVAAVAGVGNSINIGHRINIDTLVIPANGQISVKIESVLLNTSGGVSTNLTLQSSIGKVRVKYSDPAVISNTSGLGYSAGQNINSKFILDLGNVYSADGPTSYSAVRHEVYNYTSGAWLDSEDWQRKATGSSSNIIQLMLSRLVDMHGVPVKLFNGSFIALVADQLNAFTYGSDNYMLLQASFSARDNSWTGSFMKVSSTGVSITLSSTDKITGPDISIGNSDVNTLGTLNQVGVIYNAATSTSADIEAGTVTAIPIDSVGLNQANSGVKLLLINPFQNVSQELELSANWLSATTSLTVDSVTLNYTYPKGSLIAIKPNQINNKLYIEEG